MVKWCVIIWVSIMTGWLIYCARPNNGIHAIGKDAVLLSGECIVINWKASDEDANKAIEMWRKVRGRA